ncbi:phytoene desaturase family protein [Nocardia aurantia]|uniref:Zeta-carotene-forming phytoene desaturase n=1 Tax=Nocardia aurantia TaxID=2585199 RepID=A0A7K0E1M4_9NOCA|nr:phytoene desaturase family protein [Nocardia aurantia]MQY31312.1 zeta-carotene-forming phytoene desaturase [Nocardia aurantia]
MRTIRGRSDHVVVVGAGLAGLSAALHLAGRGRAVTILERDPVPGGRTGRADIGGYHLDTGPTVLTMPELIEGVFAAVGERMSDRLTLRPVEPAYRARFADGREIEVHTDLDRMADAVTAFAGHKQANGYVRLRDWLTRLYDAEFDDFIAADFDSPLSLLTPQLARLAALGGFRNWDRAVATHVTDPDLRRLFTFQSLYAGVTPDRALAAYAVIAYMDTIGGVWFPEGGMRALPDALAAAAEAAGVRIRYSTTVSGMDRAGSRVRAVVTAAGERIPCDAVVATTELADTYRMLSHRSRRPRGVTAAPSAVVVHLGCAAVPQLAHHTLLFGRAWEETFRDITVHGRVMSDPSLLLTRPTAGDPALAPAGRDLLYLLAPAPNLERGPINWDRFADAYTEELLGVVRERLPDALPDAQVLRVTTPADWARQGMTAGSPFALAHTFAQTGPFRPSNLIRGIDNVVLAGGSTVPGVGIPPVLISGRLAADRVTGRVRRSSYPVPAAAGSVRPRPASAG